MAPVLLPSPVKGQGTDTSVLYVSPPTSHSNQTFWVQVDLNLSSSEAFNAYDIQLSFNNATLGFQSLTISSQEQEISRCINGVGTGCNIRDGPNVIHSAADFSTILQGPITALTLFSVQFGVVGKGTSLFHPINDNNSLVNPNPAPHFILHLTQDGIWSNSGVTAFFNVSPAIPIVDQLVYFDGRGSFNSDGTTPVTTFSWNFGDGTPTDSGPVVSHNFTSPAPYSVTLTVVDQKGFTGKISKTVPVSSNLGGIILNIRQVGGNQLISAVTASLYNGTVFVENRTKPAFATGSVSFVNLKPGPYRVSFSGPGVVLSSVMETVIPGWTGYDTAFLTLVDQPRSDSLGFYILLLVVIGGGIALGSVAVLRRGYAKKRRSASRDRAKNR
jgi:hypothetical protein